MLRHLGIQKRIIAYVAVGLVLMFGAFFYLGVRAVDESTDLVFKERLAIAQSVAVAISRDFEHVIRDVTENVQGHSANDGEAALESLTQDLYVHVGGVDDFSFFTISSVWLLDATGQLLAEAPPGSATGSERYMPALFQQASSASPSPRVFWAANAPPEYFFRISIPLKDTRGDVWAWFLVTTLGASSSEPFVPFDSLNRASDRGSEKTSEYPQQSQYHLEVLGPSGTTILGIGPEEEEFLGQVSWHYPLVEPLMETGESKVLTHYVKDSARSEDHVMAVVPVPNSDGYLVLEQDKDVALALPNNFRNRLYLFGSLGFVATLLVAWVTTRHVVKPTEELTAAAVRMAGGQLSTRIQVKAQDEIGELAENLEVMRQQLKNALEEVETANRVLEDRVKERTRQLQDLVRRVLTAQEEERRRVALELHDETAQTLTALTVTLDSIVRHTERLTPEDAAMLREARGIATQMLEGIRRLVYALRPVALEDVGLTAALRWYADDHLERLGVAIHVSTSGREVKLPDHLEVVLYRIGQEALNNVVRHSKASNVWINIAYRCSVLSLTVRDDGVGFERDAATEAAALGGGVGLAGMRERATLVGGELTIESALGTGTTVRMEVPIPANE